MENTQSRWMDQDVCRFVDGDGRIVDSQIFGGKNRSETPTERAEVRDFSPSRQSRSGTLTLETSIRERRLV